MATPYNIVVLVGSLRKESFTLKIAKALSGLAPDTLKLDVVTLHELSFFNQDLEAAPPADWVAFREKLQKSNGVLFVTPEYNVRSPGVEERHRRRFAALRQELVPRQAGWHCQQFAGPAGCVSAAKHLQNILPGISGPILGSPKST